jgi:hypothetical protein
MKNSFFKPIKPKVILSLDFTEAQLLRDLLLAALADFEDSKDLAKKLMADFQTDRKLVVGIHKTTFEKEPKKEGKAKFETSNLQKKI